MEEARAGREKRWNRLAWARQEIQEEEGLTGSPRLLHIVKMQDNGMEGRRAGWVAISEV